MLYYIYKIENLKNGKIYIGLTNNLERRRKRHFSDLRRKCHDNSFLQKEFNEFGEENFSFEKIFEGMTTEEEIGEKEKYYIKYYDSFRNGYNQNEGGNFGAANGGTHLTQNDIYNILSALEFMSRPGAILSKYFGVSVQTISRIKHGVNHTQYYNEYKNFSEEKRKQIYENFCNTTNFYSDKVHSTILKSKRKFSKEQVFGFLFNEELGRPITLKNLSKIFKVDDGAIYSIITGKSYKDYILDYKNLTFDSKNKLVSLLSNWQQQIQEIAGNPLELEKLQHKYEIWLNANV